MINSEQVQTHISSRILEARTVLGLSQEEASELLGVPRLKLHEWETGKRLATIADLEKMVDAYGRDLAFFTEESKEDNAFQVLLRATSKDKNTRETVITFEKYCNNYRKLSDVLGYKATLASGTDLVLDDSRPLDEWMTHYAETQRESLGLGRGPITNLREVLEEKTHIKIFFTQMTESISGMFTYNHKNGASIMINTLNKTAGRQHFSLAHEFAHYLFHKRKLALISKEKSDDREEKEADIFAENFLMPAQAIRDSFYDRAPGKKNASEEDILYLADFYRVSFKAMVFRLKNLRLINHNLANRFFEDTKVNQLRAITGFDEPKMSQEKFPKIYFHLLVKAFRNRLVTAAALSDLLDTDLWSAKLEAKKIESLFLNEAAA